MTHEFFSPVLKVTVTVILILLVGCASRPQPDVEPAGHPVTAIEGEAVVTLNNQALSLKEQGQFREAAELLQSGIQAAPETPELHYNLAVISELYLFDLATALDHYQRYRELSSKEDQRVAGWIADLERRLQ